MVIGDEELAHQTADASRIAKAIFAAQQGDATYTALVLVTVAAMLMPADDFVGRTWLAKLMLDEAQKLDPHLLNAVCQ